MHLPGNDHEWWINYGGGHWFVRTVTLEGPDGILLAVISRFNKILAAHVKENGEWTCMSLRQFIFWSKGHGINIPTKEKHG